jgi:hypothetical protein
MMFLNEKILVLTRVLTLPSQISIEFKEISEGIASEKPRAYYSRLAEVMSWLIVKKGSWGLYRTNTFELMW